LTYIKHCGSLIGTFKRDGLSFRKKKVVKPDLESFLPFLPF